MFKKDESKPLLKRIIRLEKGILTLQKTLLEHQQLTQNAFNLLFDYKGQLECIEELKKKFEALDKKDG